MNEFSSRLAVARILPYSRKTLAVHGFLFYFPCRSAFFTKIQSVWFVRRLAPVAGHSHFVYCMRRSRRYSDISSAVAGRIEGSLVNLSRGSSLSLLTVNEENDFGWSLYSVLLTDAATSKKLGTNCLNKLCDPRNDRISVLVCGSSSVGQRRLLIALHWVCQGRWSDQDM